MSAIIEAKNLNLGYKDDENVIKNASFSVRAKEFVFITGASGSGKSTILSSLYGHLPIKSGNLEVFGVNMPRASKSKIHYLRQNIGIVFQDYKLVKEWNIEKNVKQQQLVGKYFTLLSKSMAPNKLDLKAAYDNGKSSVDFAYVEQSVPHFEE